MEIRQSAASFALGVLVPGDDPGVLKKITAALKQTQATADASFKPKLVRERGAVPTESGKLEKPAERLEKFDTDNGFTGGWT